MPFRVTDQPRRMSHGYVQIGVPGHERGHTPTNYVFEHIVIAERALGRPILPPIEVHHVDENKGNNANNNLVICPDKAYHQMLHRHMKALQACGNSEWLHCTYCKKYDDPKNLSTVFDKSNGASKSYHKACARDYMRAAYQRRNTVLCP
jgi:hypothetical protein